MSNVGFVESCHVCSLRAFCHRIGRISFDYYYCPSGPDGPCYPGYIPFSFCPDGHSEKILPVEAYSSRVKHYHMSAEMLENHKQTILDYLSDTRGEPITSNDIMDVLGLKHRNTTRILSQMIDDGLIDRRRSGNRFYYTLPGVKLDLPDAVDGEHVRDSIVEILRQGPLTTSQIHEEADTGLTMDATRNHIYRLEHMEIVKRVGGTNVLIWGLV